MEEMMSEFLAMKDDGHSSGAGVPPFRILDGETASKEIGVDPKGLSALLDDGVLVRRPFGSGLVFYDSDVARAKGYMKKKTEELAKKKAEELGLGVNRRAHRIAKKTYSPRSSPVWILDMANALWASRDGGMTRLEIALKFGMSDSDVTRLLSFLLLPKSFRIKMKEKDRYPALSVGGVGDFIRACAGGAGLLGLPGAVLSRKKGRKSGSGPIGLFIPKGQEQFVRDVLDLGVLDWGVAGWRRRDVFVASTWARGLDIGHPKHRKNVFRLESFRIPEKKKKKATTLSIEIPSANLNIMIPPNTLDIVIPPTTLNIKIPQGQGVEMDALWGHLIQAATLLAKVVKGGKQ